MSTLRGAGEGSLSRRLREMTTVRTPTVSAKSSNLHGVAAGDESMIAMLVGELEPHNGNYGLLE